MNWYFQYTPGDHWDYDEAHSHILVDGEIDGQPRKLITHSARNGLPLHLRAVERPDRVRQALSREHQLDGGHRPEDRQAARLRSEQGHPDLCRRCHADGGQSDQEDVPGACRRQQFLAGDLQPEDQADLHSDRYALRRPHAQAGFGNKAGDWQGGPTSRPSDSNQSTIARPAHRRDQGTTSTSPTRTTAACCRPPAAAWFHRLHRWHLRRIRRHDHGAACGRSTSAPASTRRR